MHKISIVIMGCILLLSGCSPSDEALEKKFFKNKSKLNELVNLSENCFSEKEFKHIASGEKALLKEKPCRSLMKTIGVESIFEHDPVLYFSAGSFSIFSNKGYAYSVKPLSPLFDSLDAIAFKNSAPPYEFIYKSLENNWYLYYQKTQD